MSDQGGTRRVWPGLLGLVLGWVVLVGAGSQAGNAASIGMTLNRDQVLRSCAGNADKRCGYLVFFSLVILPVWPANRPEIPGLKNSTDLLSKLPPPLASALYSSMRIYPGNCPERQLARFLSVAGSPSKSSDNPPGKIVAIPENLGRCFQANPLQKTKYFLLVIGNNIPGYYACRPDYQLAPLCEIVLSRIVRNTDKTREERLNISSFSPVEMRELIGKFPKFPAEPRNSLEEQFLSMLNWAQSNLEKVETRIAPK